MRASQTQATIANLLGMLGGLSLGQFVLPNGMAVLLGVAVPLAAVTQLFAYKSCKVVVLNTLNRQRAFILFDHLITSGEVLRPEAVSEREVFVWPFNSAVKVNPPLTQEAEARDKELQEHKFLVEAPTKAAAGVFVWFAVDATAEQVCRGFYEAMRCHEPRLDKALCDEEWRQLRQKIVESGWDISTVTFIDDKHFRVNY
jgi:hypothetical protein